MKRLGELSDFENGKGHLTEIDGVPVCVYRVDNECFVTQEMCPHRAGPLSEGPLKDYVVTCPWHGSQFDIRNGAVIKGPGARELKTYPVQIIDGMVTI
jgi:nitrite reductase/ring-hydroxylating ferredoxin subunit